VTGGSVRVATPPCRGRGFRARRTRPLHLGAPMGLINCLECGQRVGESAYSCPNCGKSPSWTCGVCGGRSPESKRCRDKDCSSFGPHHKACGDAVFRRVPCRDCGVRPIGAEHSCRKCGGSLPSFSTCSICELPYVGDGAKYCRTHGDSHAHEVGHAHCIERWRRATHPTLFERWFGS
jgi:hypothetical protein